MKKYMAIYMAPAAVIAEMMKATPGQMQKGMDDWMGWANRTGKSLVDMGSPLGKTKRISSTGIADAHNDMTGYSVVEADSLDGAAAIFRDHPHLKMGNGATIEIVEFVALQDM